MFINTMRRGMQYERQYDLHRSLLLVSLLLLVTHQSHPSVRAFASPTVRRSTTFLHNQITPGGQQRGVPASTSSNTHASYKFNNNNNQQLSLFASPSRIVSRTRTTTSLSSQNSDNKNNNNDTDDGGTSTGRGVGAAAGRVVWTPDMTPGVVPHRWLQLIYLSVLALLSDWICFSVAAVPNVYAAATNGHEASTLIDIFLFTNVASSFLVTDIVDKISLQRAVQAAAVLMAIGCWLRSGLFLPLAGAVTAATTATPSTLHQSYNWIVAGTVLVGMAQPFFQCTPPLLSALWFAPSERATSTAIALNFNQIGIATAFLVGGAMATTVAGLQSYFAWIALLSTVAALGTCLQFQDKPPIPPSTSELDKIIAGHEEPPFLESVQQFFQTPGFSRALLAFICSISITNVVGTFIENILESGGITQQLQIDLFGAAFEVAILVGGILIGGYVDRTKDYKRVLMACLAATALLVVPLGLTAGHAGTAAAAAAASAGNTAAIHPFLLVGALLGLGTFAGPVQPISAELAVDVTYPGDETAVESVQQIFGNLVSALLVPIAAWASHHEFQLPVPSSVVSSLFSFFDSTSSSLSASASASSSSLLALRGDVLVLLGVALVTLASFSTFSAPLARTMADTNKNNNNNNNVNLLLKELPIISNILQQPELEQEELGSSLNATDEVFVEGRNTTAAGVSST